MFGPGRLDEPAGHAANGEHHLQVLALGSTHDIEEEAGMAIDDAVAEGGEIRGRITEAAALHLHDERQRVAVPVREAGREDAQRAFALGQETLRGQLVDDRTQLLVVGALADKVVGGQ